jgi:hypothetical protein
MPTQIDVKIHTSNTLVLIYVSVLGKTFVGSIDIEVIGDLHEKSDMTPEEAEGYVVRYQQAFADIVLAKFVSAPNSFAAIPGTPHILKSELQLKDWGLFSRPFLMPDLSPSQ